MLITAGEFNRRRGNLERAEDRYNSAVKMLEHDLATTEHPQAIHKELGRVFYELAYLQVLRGDAGAARSTFERSEAECELAADVVGAEIARAGLAGVSLEEGAADEAVRGLTTCLSELERLVDEPATMEAGRSGFARRWAINVKISLVQAHVAAGNCRVARSLFGELQADREHGPPIMGLATFKLIEAKLFLAEGNLNAAQDAIGASWNAIERRGDLMSTELAAGTVAISGVIHALEEVWTSARPCFEEAGRLLPELHNRTAQGWAWAGLAIRAKDTGDHAAFLSAVHQGLAVVQRCGAPVRAFLLDLLRGGRSGEGGPHLEDLRDLVCRSG